jgi:uncharacterized protein
MPGPLSADSRRGAPAPRDGSTLPDDPTRSRGLRPSRYNHIFEAGAQRLGFQGRTGAVVSLDETTWRVFENAARRPARAAEAATETEAATLATLVETGFLVPDRLDEVLAVRRLFYLAGYASPELNVVIAPTLACNLACSYCFEAGRPRERLSAEVAAAIPSFVRRFLDRFRRLRVIWYGGEPLLALDIMASLTPALQAVASEAGVTYEARVITNGLLLTRDVTDKLVDLGVGSAQVTLDGPAALHDARRTAHGGGPTWAAIVSNIADAADRLEVLVRMTVGDGEARLVADLAQELDRQGVPSSVPVFPAPLCRNPSPPVDSRPETSPPARGSGSCPSGGCRSDEAFLAQLLAAGLIAPDAIHPRLRLPAPDPGPGCLATSAFGFAIAPDGSLHRCLETLGDSRWIVGSVLPDPVNRPDGGGLLDPEGIWSAADPFLGGPCPDCSFLPLCLGGCPKAYLTTGIRLCTPFRGRLFDWVRAVAGCG